MVSAAHLSTGDGATFEGVVVDNRIMFGQLGEELTRVDDGSTLSITLQISTHPSWPETPALHLRFSPAQDIVTMGESSRIARDGQSFEVGPGITWWKSIQIRLNNGAKTLQWTQDGTTVAVPWPIVASELPNGNEVAVEFWKAKVFGVHTYVGEAKNKWDSIAGKEVTFIWEND